MSRFEYGNLPKGPARMPMLCNRYAARECPSEFLARSGCHRHGRFPHRNHKDSIELFERKANPPHSKLTARQREVSPDSVSRVHCL